MYEKITAKTGYSDDNFSDSDGQNTEGSRSRAGTGVMNEGRSVHRDYAEYGEKPGKGTRRRILVKVHLLVYFMINLLLMLLNNSGRFTLEGYQWWIWVASGWGVGLLFHLFVYFTRSPRGFMAHLFTFAVISGYLLFIDFYIDGTAEWAWIPAISWGVFVAAHFLIRGDLRKIYIPKGIYGFFIMDSEGRVMVEYVLDPAGLKKYFGGETSSSDMVGMFINALYAFGEEIRLENGFGDELNIMGRRFNIVSLKHPPCTLVGYMNSKVYLDVAAEFFREILESFMRKYGREIKIFEKTGNCTLFSGFTLENVRRFE